MNFEELILKLKRQTKEIANNQNNFTGIGQAWDEIMVPLGMESAQKMSFRQNRAQLLNNLTATEALKKNWDLNKK